MTVAKKAPSADLIDQLMAGYQKPEDLIGEHLKKITRVRYRLDSQVSNLRN